MARRGDPPPTAAELDWEPMADGRPWRLRRGKDFVGETRPVQKAARNAAATMGKAVTTLRDQSGKWDYIWVQFADYALPEGQPCPRCGGTEMVREAKAFARCGTCSATLILEEPLDEPAEPTPRTPLHEPVNLESEFGKVLSSRLLSEDGEEIEELSVAQDATIEVLLKVSVPVLKVVAHVAVWSEGVKAFLWRERLEVEEAGVYRLAIQLPGGLLAERSYSTSVQAVMVIGDSRIRVKQNGPPAFRVHELEDRPPRRDGILRPDLEWGLTRLSTAGPAPAPSPDPSATVPAPE